VARILRQVTVARDGWHNGFTDLQHWQGCYWVAYRKGAAHASRDGQAVVSVSADRARFREAARLRVPGDNRDPKLLPLGDTRLALYFPSWTEGYEARKLQQYIAFSDNGFDWSKPAPILDPGLWLWRIRRHGGRYYGLVQNLQGDWRENRRPHQLDLAVSDDLLAWEVLARVGEERGLNESDIAWQASGEAWIVARSARAPANSCFCAADAPWTDWRVSVLPVMVQAPVFLRHGGALYVAGRCDPVTAGNPVFPFAGPGLGLWRVQPGRLEPVLHIPATGDCSYPGLIEDPEGRVCLSYYSQHAYHLGVLPCPAGTDLPDDVYFAELEL
jgi:hypothetical protein